MTGLNISNLHIRKLLKEQLMRLSERQRILLLSLVVGVVCGFAAVILEQLITFIKAVLTNGASGYAHTIKYFIYPGIGMLISMLLLRFVIKDNIGHGVTKVLLSVSKNESKIKAHNMWSSLLTSAVTIGFGGSVGAEAPIVYTGAAIGSNFARYLGLSYRNMTLMLGCGAAGALAGIFKAPLAGVLFTLEILLFNISMTSMIPLLLSTVSATVVSYIFLGDAVSFECTLTPFSLGNIPFYIVLGFLCGLFSVYFIRTTLMLEDRIGRMRNPYLRWLLCAIGLGLLIALFPPLYGEGYDSLGVLLNGGTIEFEGLTPLAFILRNKWGVPLFFLTILMLKVFSMALTNAGGGVGGTFGPTLFIGALVGFVVARLINLISANMGISVPEQNFVLVGMAGLMAGVMQAPMTAIFLIAEISGGYELLLPLILTATIAFGTTRLFEKYSIYTKRIAQSGELLTHDNDQAVLTLMKTRDLIRDKYPRVKEDATLRDVVKVISESDAQVFAVIDDKQHMKGVLEMDNLRKFMFKTDKYDTLRVYNIMQRPLAYVYEEEKMESVLDKFEKTGAWRLPVIDTDGKYLGFVSKSRILSEYRRELKEISQD
ncbi:MAG: chloride channel protein [Bacteroidales bacterium]|nr:chloride channel protein [Bacteroidales bacterium]